MPNLSLGCSDGRVVVNRNDATWEENAAARYFTYELHVSKQFLLTTSLASALYLCVMRYLSKDYERCFALADSVGSDRPFDQEESQIFAVLIGEELASTPDACACLCKIAIALGEGTSQIYEFEYHAAMYVERVVEVSTRVVVSTRT